MYTSAQCLFELVEAVRRIATLTPINEVSVLFLRRILDGIADLAGTVAYETEFRIRPRPFLRLIVNDKPVQSRRRQPTLRLITTERENTHDYRSPSPDYVA